MQKNLLIVVVIGAALVLLSGGVKIKKVTMLEYGANDINTGISNNATKNSGNTFKYYVGKVNYFDEGKSMNSFNISVISQKDKNGGEQGLNSDKSFGSLSEFDNYVLGLKNQADEAYKVAKQANYTDQDLNLSIDKLELVNHDVKNIVIPENIIRTELGRYYAQKYAKEEFESLIQLRIDLLKFLKKEKEKSTKYLSFKIKSLRDMLIPAKEKAVEFDRKCMMEEEGYN